jgi:hypothetical protein
MKSVLYTKGRSDIAEKLIAIVSRQISETRIMVCNSIELLSNKLRQPLNNISVIILLITSRDELIQLNLMSSLFDNSRVILILPDRDKATLSLGFELKTSFVSYIDSDLQNVISVLKQIQKKLKGDKQNV